MATKSDKGKAKGKGKSKAAPKKLTKDQLAKLQGGLGRAMIAYTCDCISGKETC